MSFGRIGQVSTRAREEKSKFFGKWWVGNLNAVIAGGFSDLAGGREVWLDLT